MKIQFKNHISIANARACLPISVGQLYHEGKKFQATLNGVQNKFGSCDIIIADTLQKYNQFSQYSFHQALQISLEQGSEWLTRNEPLLKAITIPSAIIRWDECCNDPDFAIWSQKIKELYNSNPDYQKAVEEDVDIFMQRSGRKNTVHKRTHSRLYFFEETAVILSYFVRKQYQYIIYPRPMPKSISFACQYLFSKNQNHMIQSIHFRFR